MGNLDALLKELGGDNASAAQIAGDGLGTLADLSGAGAAVVAAYQLLVGTGDKSQEVLQRIVDRINAGFKLIGEDLKGEHLISTFQALGDLVGHSLAVLD